MAWTSQLPSNQWRRVASSSTGQYLAAISSRGGVYMSPDWGVTWTQTLVEITLAVNPYGGITSSSDGSRIAVCRTGAANNNDYIYVSSNYGVTLTRITSMFDKWSCITSSSTGQYIMAGTGNTSTGAGYFVRSTDYGATWNTYGNAPSDIYTYITSSSNGSVLIAMSTKLYISIDYGLHWNQITLPSLYINCCALSLNGSSIAIGVYNGNIYISTNNGVSWGPPSASVKNWIGISSSQDGTYLAACVGSPSGNIYTSTDSGVTWETRGFNIRWACIASSDDGTRRIAGPNSGYIYTSRPASITTHTVNNKDLNTIFYPYASGTKASITHYTAGGNDLNTIFAPYVSGNKASITNMAVNGNDLCNIFQPL